MGRMGPAGRRQAMKSWFGTFLVTIAVLVSIVLVLGALVGIAILGIENPYSLLWSIPLGIVLIGGIISLAVWLSD